MRLGRRELAGLAVLGLVAMGTLVTSPARTLRWLAGLADRPLAFVGLLVAVWIVRPFLGWPTMAVSAAVGYVLGPVVGFPVAMLGVVVTSAPPFLAAGWFADGHEGPLSTVGDHGRAYFRATGDIRGVAAARLAPVPADAVSCAAGLSDVRPGAYAVGTLAGELPWTAAAVVVGGSARRLTTVGLQGFGVPLLAATTIAATLLLAGPAYRVFAGMAPPDRGG